jgi:hypothetical protein
MSEIVLKRDGAVVRYDAEFMGSTKTHEDEVSYDELNREYDLQMAPSRISPQERGDSFEIRIQMDSVSSEKEPTKEEKDLPEVPKVRLSDIRESRRQYYRGIKKLGSQPYDIRRTIRSAGKLTERELKERLNQEGHDNIKPGKQHGAVSGTLVVLDEETEEIERRGRGESKTIEWIGE